MASRGSSPLFVMGASRSGTAMVRSALNNHPEIFLAGESHYFDDLRPKVAGYERASLPPELRTTVEDYFLALTHRPYGHQGESQRSTVERAELRERAGALGEGADAYFEAYCRLEAGADIRYWGEKTPRHIFRIDDIASAYPDARFLCMVRDPRAVVASYRDWRNQGGFDIEADPSHADAIAADEERVHRSYHLVTSSLLWRSAANAGTRAQERFGAERVRIQRYEEVVQDPDRAMQGLARWLGVPFVEAMLDVPMHNSSVARFDLSSGVSMEPVERWRRKLSPTEIATVQKVCASTMAAHGYATVEAPADPLQLLRTWATFPVSVGRAALANRSRMGSLPAYVWRRVGALRAG